MHKLFWYDLRIGMKSNMVKLIAYISIVIGICIIGCNTIHNSSEFYNVTPDVLDYICFILGGPRYIPEGMIEIYTIPVLWLIIPVMIGYIIGYYAMTDLHKYGQQVLLRSASRTRWWLSKCIWCGLMVVISYAIIYVFTILTAFISGATFNWKLTDEIAVNACNVSYIGGTDNEVRIILLLMPVIVSLALSILQILLGLVFSPIIGFMLTQSIVFLATIYHKSFLIANYAMLSHNRLTCDSNIDYIEGIYVCAGVYIISLILGILYFRGYNILPKNHEI